LPLRWHRAAVHMHVIMVHVLLHCTYSKKSCEEVQCRVVRVLCLLESSIFHGMYV
jgi:hypothetical protein